MDAAAFHRSIGGQVEHWARIGQAFEQVPGFTLDRVRAAVEGRLNPDSLTEAEAILYEDLAWAAAGAPTQGALAFAEAIRAHPGAVGDDEHGRMVRVLADGSLEIIG